jgi:GAF domain-containing protein
VLPLAGGAATVASRMAPVPTAGRIRELLQQQYALRELATAVGEMRAPDVIYELVAKQAAEVAGLDSGAVVRFRVDGVGEVVGSWRTGNRQTGRLIPLDGAGSAAVVARTGRPARLNVHDALHVPKRSANQSQAPTPGGVAVPIRVLAELWGCLCATSRDEALVSDDVEGRLGMLADLVGLAITNTDTNARLLSQATSDPLTGLLNHRARFKIGSIARLGGPYGTNGRSRWCFSISTISRA